MYATGIPRVKPLVWVPFVLSKDPLRLAKAFRTHSSQSLQSTLCDKTGLCQSGALVHVSSQ
eukprot:3387235-Amphidinium_carterae.3